MKIKIEVEKIERKLHVHFTLGNMQPLFLECEKINN